MTEGRLLDAEASASGGRCLGALAPLLMAVAMVAGAVACLVVVGIDLRHHSRLAALLALPSSQLDETDPQALSATCTSTNRAAWLSLSPCPSPLDP